MRSILAIIAGLLLCSSVGAQSGVITGPGGTSQCYVLVDSVPATYSCFYRASVACVNGQVGYVGSFNSSQPLTYPLYIQLYQRPNQSPSGVLTLPQLPTTAGGRINVWLNGVGGSWVLSAPFAGQSCAPAISGKPRG